MRVIIGDADDRRESMFSRFARLLRRKAAEVVQKAKQMTRAAVAWITGKTHRVALTGAATVAGGAYAGSAAIKAAGFSAVGMVGPGGVGIGWPAATVGATLGAVVGVAALAVVLLIGTMFWVGKEEELSPIAL